jgi:putative aldouronate transport system permease protein
MSRKLSRGEKIFSSFNLTFLSILVVLTVYPVLYVVFASVSDPKELLKHVGPIIWPLGKANLKGYEMTLRNPNIIKGYRNTVFYLVTGTSLNLILTFLFAYVLSRKDFYIKKFLMVMMVVTMFFSGGLIPLFFVVRTLGIYDHWLALILPTAINSFNVIITRTFFMSIPESLEESAILDGAGDWTILTRIILPLSMPVVAVMILYYGVFHWNSWFHAFVFLRNREYYPLQLFLREILIYSSSSKMIEGAREMREESYFKELIKYCTIVVSTLPILAAYPFLQRYFVKGVMIGALKG